MCCLFLCILPGKLILVPFPAHRQQVPSIISHKGERGKTNWWVLAEGSGTKRSLGDKQASGPCTRGIAKVLLGAGWSLALYIGHTHKHKAHSRRTL